MYFFLIFLGNVIVWKQKALKYVLHNLSNLDFLLSSTPLPKGTQKKKIQQIREFSWKIHGFAISLNTNAWLWISWLGSVSHQHRVETTTPNIRKSSTQGFHIYPWHVVNLPQFGFYCSVQIMVPEVDQISNKCWLCFKGARATLELQVQRLRNFLFHINLTKSECHNFSHTARIFPNPCLLQGHLSGNLALSL